MSTIKIKAEDNCTRECLPFYFQGVKFCLYRGVVRRTYTVWTIYHYASGVGCAMLPLEQGKDLHSEVAKRFTRWHTQEAVLRAIAAPIRNRNRKRDRVKWALAALQQ